MKTSKLLTASLFILGIMISGSVLAQTNFTNGSTQIVRNTSDITYSVGNTDATTAIFQWTVTNGIIYVGGINRGTTYTSPVVASGASTTIDVRWDNTSKTSANDGTVIVSKTVGTLSCPSAPDTLNVQSWVAPSASVSTAPFVVCSATASSVNLAFQGNPGTSGYLYRWRVVRVSDGFVMENHPSDISSASATPTVNIVAIANATAAPIQYRFELTQMQDGFTDIAAGDITAGSVLFTVNPVPTIGTINSSSSLILR